MSKFVDYPTPAGDNGCQRQKIGLNIIELSSQGVAAIDQIPKKIKNGVQQG